MSDLDAPRFPVSVKGVVLLDGLVVLVTNPRGEWELPGGKLEAGETPETCVAREIAEELALAVRVDRLLDAWIYPVTTDATVLVIAYGCHAHAPAGPLRSPEGKAIGYFPPEALPERLPEGYRRAIAAWAGSSR